MKSFSFLFLSQRFQIVIIIIIMNVAVIEKHKMEGSLLLIHHIRGNSAYHARDICLNVYQCVCVDVCECKIVCTTHGLLFFQTRFSTDTDFMSSWFCWNGNTVDIFLSFFLSLCLFSFILSFIIFCWLCFFFLCHQHHDHHRLSLKLLFGNFLKFTLEKS